MNAINSKKFCFFIGALKAGGAERVIVWLAKMFAASGAQVSLVTLESGGADFISLDPSIKRHSLDLYGSSRLLNKPFANLNRIIKLRDYLSRHEVDVIVAFMPHESVMAVLAALGTKCRAVISERTAPWQKSPSKIWCLLRWAFYRFSDCQVAQTRQIAEWFEKEVGCSAVRVIPNSVQYPLPDNPPQKKPHDFVREGEEFLLAVGTKPYQKGFDILLDAFSVIAEAHKNWQLVILGIEPGASEKDFSFEDLNKKVSESGLQSRVHFPGKVGNVSSWYDAADVFVLSSRYEGFPNVLIEAMSYGCASVAMDCDTGPSDIITHGRNGYLVKDVSSESLAAALSHCMADKHFREKMSQEAKDIVNEYNPQSIFELWSNALRFN